MVRDNGTHFAPYNRVMSLVFRPHFVVASLGVHPEKCAKERYSIENVNLRNNLVRNRRYFSTDH